MPLIDLQSKGLKSTRAHVARGDGEQDAYWNYRGSGLGRGLFVGSGTVGILFVFV